MVSAILPSRYADLRFAKPHKFPKGNGFILFASTKRTKSSPEGCDPLDSEGRFKTLQNIFSCCFRLSSLSRYVVRPAFSDVLNRCERVAVVQTQDRYFSKMGYCTASSQGRMYSKRVAHVIFIAVGFVFAVCGLKFQNMPKFLLPFKTAAL